MTAAPGAARTPAAGDSRAGLAFGTGAFLLWGVTPLYFKIMAHVPVGELLAHRIVWSLALATAIISVAGRWRETAAMLRSRRTVLALTAASLLLCVNWGTFIYAIVTGQMLQGSLGYFINPLVSVALGALVLHERLAPRQWLAVAIAAAGVLCQLVLAGEVPWIALLLAGAFALYGLIRKTAAAAAQPGLLFEMAVMAPPSLFYLGWLAVQGTGHFGVAGLAHDLWLVLAGPVTAVPLVLFAAGARRLRLATIGLLQYIAPTAIFVLAVAAFGEPFDRIDVATFALIWAAIAVYSAGERPAGGGSRR